MYVYRFSSLSLSMHVCFVLFPLFDLSFVDFPSVLWYCWLGLLTCKNRLPYNLYCVGGVVKPCTIQSNLVPPCLHFSVILWCWCFLLAFHKFHRWQWYSPVLSAAASLSTDYSNSLWFLFILIVFISVIVCLSWLVENIVMLLCLLIQCTVRMFWIWLTNIEQLEICSSN